HDTHSFPTRRSSDLETRLQPKRRIEKLPLPSVNKSFLDSFITVSSLRAGNRTDTRRPRTRTCIFLMASCAAKNESFILKIVLVSDRKSTRLNSSHGS